MVLVCGATGLLGERVTRRLAARGVPLRLLLRDDASDAIARELGAEVVRGDLREPDTLRPAVKGAETVVTTATAIARALDGDATWTEEPLRALGIEPRSVTAYAAQVTREA